MQKNVNISEGVMTSNSMTQWNQVDTFSLLVHFQYTAATLILSCVAFLCSAIVVILITKVYLWLYMPFHVVLLFGWHRVMWCFQCLFWRTSYCSSCCWYTVCSSCVLVQATFHSSWGVVGDSVSPMHLYWTCSCSFDGWPPRTLLNTQMGCSEQVEDVEPIPNLPVASYKDRCQ